MAWNRETSRERIKKSIAQCQDIKITNYRSTTDFDSLGLERAVRVDGVHVYVDIVNAEAMLCSDNTESDRSHRRYLRFMHLFQRVAHGVLGKTDAIKVAFQNQRLHFVVCDPVGDEAKRLAVAVAIAQLLIDVIERGNELHAELADAEVAVGLDTGRTLAVRNGTRGERELLFLGNAANKAAHAVPKRSGIAVADAAKNALGWATSRPTKVEIAACQEKAGLRIKAETLVDQWKRELRDTPLQEFQFTRPMPPLKDLDFNILTPANSRHIECASVYADIDGYTAYVSAHINDDKKAEEAVRALHVIRKELRDTLNDLGGRKVRYIGDCLHGVIARGARETDEPGTVTDALLVAGAMRDAFGIAKKELKDVDELGLAIGVEFGPTTLTRLGVKGVRDRIAAGVAVGAAETAQRKCSGRETGLGTNALAVLANAPKTLKILFDSAGQAEDLGYNTVTIAAEVAGDRNATAAYTSPNPPSTEFPRAHCDR